MNINNVEKTPVHVAFEEVSTRASERGVKVSGAEIVGLIPKKCLIDAGRFYLSLQKRSLGITEAEIIKIAIKSMGLEDIKPFNPKEKIIEYLLEDDEPKLIDFTCEDFANETASESPAPGGGSISAYVGSLGAALATMVANLSAHKAGWDDRWEEFSDVAEKGQRLKDELLHLVDEDTKAFNKIMDAFSLPKNTDVDKLKRGQAIQDATKFAIEVPLQTMKTSFEIFDLCEAMLNNGNPNSKSDALVGVLCARTAVLGAFFNVRINCESCKDKTFVEKIMAEAEDIKTQAIDRESALLS
jgi:glutamate formiminotransferase/formiminotetrahydrofolate cyclodeaminase